MSWLSSMMHPGQGYEDAANELKQQTAQAQGYLDPYTQAGSAQLPTLTGAQQSLMDPSKMVGDWMGQYQESPYTKMLRDQSMQAGQTAAAQSGLGGSNTAMGGIQQQAGDISQQGMDNYLNRMMGMYGQGVGIGQNIYGTGASAAGSQAGIGANMANQLSSLKYGQTQAGSNMLGGIMGGIGGIAGTALGGPLGGALGSYLFGGKK